MVSGRYPVTARGQLISAPHRMDRSDITVAVNRSPSAIAKEIARRLLPEYRRVLVVVRDFKYHIDSYESAQEANLIALAEILTVDPSGPNAKEGTLRLGSRSRGPWGEVEVFDTTVNMTLRRIPIRHALELARLLVQADPADEQSS